MEIMLRIALSSQNYIDDQDEYNFLNNIIGNLVKEDQNFIDMFYRKGLSQKNFS